MLGRGSVPLQPLAVVANLGYVQRAFDLPHLQEIYWTLCLEIQFYLLFAVAIALGGRKRTFLIAATFAVSIACGFAGYDTNDWWAGHWHGFALGVMTYEANRSGESVMRWLAFLVPVAALGLYRRRPEEFVLVSTAVALGLALRWGRLDRWLAWRPLVSLGRISYSLYLMHGLMGTLIYGRLRGVLGRDEKGIWTIILAGMIASFATAILLYRMVEIPSMRISKQWTRPRPEG